MKFINIDASQALDAFVDKKSKNLLKRVEAYHDRYKFSMNIKPRSRKKDGSVKTFSVVGVVKIKSVSDIRAEFESTDPKLAVKKVIDSLEKQIRRHTEKSERSRSTLGRSLKPIRQFKFEVSH